MRYSGTLGNRVSIVTTKSVSDRFDANYFPGLEVQRRPIVARVKGPHVSVPIYFPDIDVTERMIIGQFDVVHSFTFLTFSSILGTGAMRAKKILRTEIGPPVSEVNGYKTIFGQIHASMPLRGLLRFYDRSFDYFTAYTTDEIESLKLLGIRNEKIVLLPPMIDYDSFRPLALTRRNETIRLGCISRLDRIKGVDRLIEPLDRLSREESDFVFLLAGRIETEQMAYGQGILVELRNRLGERHFKYLGEVAPPHKFYGMVDVVINPSRFETGAIGVLEAMAAGKTVIASDIYPMNKYITHGRDGFLFKDEETLHSILEGLHEINTSEICERAAVKARDFDYKGILNQSYKPLIS